MVLVRAAAGADDVGRLVCTVFACPIACLARVAALACVVRCLVGSGGVFSVLTLSPCVWDVRRVRKGVLFSADSIVGRDAVGSGVATVARRVGAAWSEVADLRVVCVGSVPFVLRLPISCMLPVFVEVLVGMRM